MAASSFDSCSVVILLLLGLLQLHRPAVLFGQFHHTVILVRERGDHVRWNKILERKGLGLMILSGVALLYIGVIAGLEKR